MYFHPFRFFVWSKINLTKNVFVNRRTTKFNSVPKGAHKNSRPTSSQIIEASVVKEKRVRVWDLDRKTDNSQEDGKSKR